MFSGNFTRKIPLADPAMSVVTAGEGKMIAITFFAIADSCQTNFGNFISVDAACQISGTLTDFCETWNCSGHGTTGQRTIFYSFFFFFHFGKLPNNGCVCALQVTSSVTRDAGILSAGARALTGGTFFLQKVRSLVVSNCHFSMIPPCPFQWLCFLSAVNWREGWRRAAGTSWSW